MSRIKTAMALVAISGMAPLMGTPSRADEIGATIPAAGNPHLIDFEATSSKRSDLRVRVAEKGLDAAFSGWLRSTRPTAYERAARRLDTASNGLTPNRRGRLSLAGG